MGKADRNRKRRLRQAGYSKEEADAINSAAKSRPRGEERRSFFEDKVLSGDIGKRGRKKVEAARANREVRRINKLRGQERLRAIEESDVSILAFLGKRKDPRFNDVSDQFIKKLYRDSLGREASTAEIARIRESQNNDKISFWVQGLNNEGGELRERKLARKKIIDDEIDRLKAGGLTGKQARADINSRLQGGNIRQFINEPIKHIRQFERNIEHGGDLAEEGGLLGSLDKLMGGKFATEFIDETMTDEILAISDFGSGGAVATVMMGKEGYDDFLNGAEGLGFDREDFARTSQYASYVAEIVADFYSGGAASVAFAAARGTQRNILDPSGTDTLEIATNIGISVASMYLGAQLNGSELSDTEKALVRGAFASGVSSARGGDSQDNLNAGLIAAGGSAVETQFDSKAAGAAFKASAAAASGKDTEEIALLLAPAVIESGLQAGGQTGKNVDKKQAKSNDDFGVSNAFLSGKPQSNLPDTGVRFQTRR